MAALLLHLNAPTPTFKPWTHVRTGNQNIYKLQCRIVSRHFRFLFCQAYKSWLRKRGRENSGSKEKFQPRVNSPMVAACSKQHVHTERHVYIRNPWSSSSTSSTTTTTLKACFCALIFSRAGVNETSKAPFMPLFFNSECTSLKMLDYGVCIQWSRASGDSQMPRYENVSFKR